MKVYLIYEISKGGLNSELWWSSTDSETSYEKLRKYQATNKDKQFEMESIFI